MRKEGQGVIPREFQFYRRIKGWAKRKVGKARRRKEKAEIREWQG